MIDRYLVSVLITTAKVYVSLFLASVPLVVAAALSTAPAHPPEDPAPSPGLGPSEVVRIQVEALRNNSPLDEGIELTYRFASPGNKRYTGPLDRFIEMLHSDPYDRLLNHQSARYGPIAISGDEAHQIVIITDMDGELIAYHWVLSRQSVGEFEDCWMTNAVVPAEQPTQREFVQISIQHLRTLAPIGWPGTGHHARNAGSDPVFINIFRNRDLLPVLENDGEFLAPRWAIISQAWC